MKAKFQTYSDTTGKWTTHVRTVERVETFHSERIVYHFTNGQCLAVTGISCEFYGKDRGNRGARLPRRKYLGMTLEKPEVTE